MQCLYGYKNDLSEFIMKMYFIMKSKCQSLIQRKEQENERHQNEMVQIIKRPTVIATIKSILKDKHNLQAILSRQNTRYP